MAAALRIYQATVLSLADPQALGRVKLGTTRTVRGTAMQQEGWAAMGAAPLAGGVVAVAPLAEGDTVLYAAERLPFVGAVVLCVAGRAAPPAAGDLALRVALGDGQEATIEAATGSLSVRTSAGQQVRLQAGGDIEVSGPSTVLVSGNQVRLAGNMVVVDAGMTKFSGVVQCDTLIATNVMASTYTPGAGNLV